MAKKDWFSKNEVKDGDILLLKSGEMVRIWRHTGDLMNSSVQAEWLDCRPESQYLYAPEYLEIWENLGQSNNIVATFYAAKSIHERLNALSKV